MEEMHRAKYGERGTELPYLSGAPPRVHQPESSPNPTFLGFYGGFIKYAWLIKSLASPSLLPRGQGQELDWNFEPSNHTVGSPGNQAPGSLGTFQKSLH